MYTDNTDMISQYLTGSLTKRERTTFERRLKGDNMLRGELELARKLRYTLTNTKGGQLQQTVMEDLKDIPIEPDYDALEQMITEGEIDTPEKGEATLNNQSKMWIGGLAFIAIVLVLLLMPRSLSDTQKLGQKYLKPLPMLTNPDPNSKDDYDMAFTAYDSRQYSEATKYFEKYLEKSNKEENIKLYLGIAQLYAYKYKDALITLNSLKESEDSFVQIHITWYLALAYLHNDEEDRAKALLKQLKYHDKYGEDANRVLSDFN